MEKYIKDLTSNLIGQHGFDIQFTKIGDPDEFVSQVKSRLLLGAVQEMTPQTIGKIISKFNYEFEPEDLEELKKTLFNEIPFRGDFEESLRHLTAFLLAVEIGDILSERRNILAIAE